MLYALWTVAGVLLVIWLCGVTGIFSVGSGINLLMVVAVLMVMGSLFTRPRTV